MKNQLQKNGLLYELNRPFSGYNSYSYCFRLILGLIALVILIPFLTGVLRYYFALPFETCKLLAIVLAIIFYFFELLCFSIAFEFKGAFLKNSDIFLRSFLIFLIFSGIIVYFLFSGMWNQYYHGFPIRSFLGGGDSIAHVENTIKFTESDPQVYMGQVGFYSMAKWFGAKIGIGFFRSFRTSTYTLWSVFLLAGAIPWFPFITQKIKSFNSLFIFIFSTILTLLFCHFSILPWLSYLQLDGFHTATAGYTCLILGIVFVTTSPNLILKTFWFFIFVILIRHTYVLNLGEYLFAGAIMFVLDSRQQLPIIRNIFVSLSLLCSCISIALYVSFFQLRGIYGGFDNWQLVLGIIFEILTIVIAYWSLQYIYKNNTPTLYKYIYFCMCFVSVGFVMQILYLITGLEARYYFFKHGYGVFLVAVNCFMTCCIYLSTLYLTKFQIIFQQRSFENKSAFSFEIAFDPKLIISKKTMILSIVLFLILTELTASVRILYTKRSIRAPAWEPLSPQIDVSSVRSIEQILKIKKAQFGGYIHGNESLWGFTTMSFGKDWRGIFYQNLNEKTGDCNFWAEGNYVLELIEENATINADKSNIEMKENGKKKLFYYKSLIDNPSKTCEESKALTPPEYKERLCWICY